MRDREESGWLEGGEVVGVEVERGGSGEVNGKDERFRRLGNMLQVPEVTI